MILTQWYMITCNLFFVTGVFEIPVAGKRAAKGLKTYNSRKEMTIGLLLEKGSRQQSWNSSAKVELPIYIVFFSARYDDTCLRR